MASTTFLDNQTVIYAAWLNDVNNAVYNGIFASPSITATSMICNGTASGAGFTNLINNSLSAPGAIGSATPNTGAFTTLSATTGNITTGNFTTLNASTVTNTPAIKSSTAGLLPSLQDSTGSQLQSITTNGYCYLNGGLILQWGRRNGFASGEYFNFPIAFPNAVFSFTFNVRATSAPSTANIVVGNATTTQYAFWASNSNDMYWMAIGY